MNAHHKETVPQSGFKRLMRGVGMLLLTVTTLSLVTHVSWNMFAPDLFDLPRIAMKEALGLVLMAGVVAFVLRHGAKGPRKG